MRILYLYGWHSVTGGVKPTYLRARGCTVFEPELSDDDFEFALSVAQEWFDRLSPDVIVGSSRGGALAMNLKHGDTPLVLLCPAWRRWGTVQTLPKRSVILHSPHDDVIAFEDSLALIEVSGLSIETLLEVGRDHRLADADSLAVMHWACAVSTSEDGSLWSGQSTSDASQAQRNRMTESQLEGNYVCDGCGEEIVIPLDLSEGTSQSYVEDCPVCCRANVIHVVIDARGHAQVRAEPEQDRD